MTKDLVGKSIFLLDMGFGYFSVCKRFLNQGRNFCIRISPSISSFGKALIENPSTDFITYWYPSRKEKKSCFVHGLDNEPIRVRVTKIKLKTGEIEVLVSSLYDMDSILPEDMDELYQLRWGIEEGYKKLKPKMKLEHFGSRKPEGIFQEFEAHLFMMNLVALVGGAAQQEVEKKCGKRKYKYRYNWQNAFRFVRAKVVALLNHKDPKSLIQLLIGLISASVVALIPQRNFSREGLITKKTRLHQTYK